MLLRIAGFAACLLITIIETGLSVGCLYGSWIQFRGASDRFTGAFLSSFTLVGSYCFGRMAYHSILVSAELWRHVRL